MAPVAGYKKLLGLWLNGTRVGNDGLASIRDLSLIVTLNIRDTRIGDAGLAHVAGLARIHSLYLLNTAVTDAGLIHLRKLPPCCVRSTSMTTEVTDVQGWYTWPAFSGLKHLHVKPHGGHRRNLGAAALGQTSSFP